MKTQNSAYGRLLYKDNPSTFDAKFVIPLILREMEQLKILLEYHRHGWSDNSGLYEYRRINRLREYLDRAYALAGPSYTLSPEEERAKRFDERLPDIQRITLDIIPFFSLGSCYEVSFKGETAVVKQSNSFKDSENVWTASKEDFLNSLHNLYIGEWLPTYFNYMVCDGIRWAAEFQYTRGDSCQFYGCNGYPYNFHGFVRLLDSGQGEIDTHVDGMHGIRRDSDE